MKKKHLILLTFVLLAVVTVSIALQLLFPQTSINLLNTGKIKEMAEHLNKKYGYSFSAEDCFYFREEDYTFHGDAFGFGKTYNIPNIAAFQIDGRTIVVSDRNGFISDDGQLDELNQLLCEYFEDLTGLRPEYVAIRNSGNGNDTDFTVNHILQYQFNQRITAENVVAFMDCVWNTEDLELVFYFAQQEDTQLQLEQITTELKKLGSQVHLRSLQFYIRRADKKLNIVYRQPDLNTEYLEYNSSNDHYDDYKFAFYYVGDDYHQLPQTYTYAGVCQLGRSYDKGFGSYESELYNGWMVATFE